MEAANVNVVISGGWKRRWKGEQSSPFIRVLDSPFMIREASAEDLESLEEIENDADALFIDRFQPEVWWRAPSGAVRAAAPGFVLVAVDLDATVVGFVHVLEVDGGAHLEQLSVRRTHARRGCGRALVEAAKSEGARRGHREMTLRTYAEVPWNAPFYVTMGFRTSAPVSEFHRSLLLVEAELGLERYGRRVQMTASLSSGGGDVGVRSSALDSRPEVRSRGRAEL